MKRYLLTTLLATTTAFADPYIEVGLGYNLNTNNTYCVKERVDTTCLDGPLGFAAVGYEYKNFSVSYEHWSNIVERDYGMNIIAVKYRYTFGE